MFQKIETSQDLQVKSSPRLAVLLRSPKVSWHRLQWSGEARILTKWEVASYKAELTPSSGNNIFGKAPAKSTRPLVTNLSEAEVPSEAPPVFEIEEGEECKVQ